MRRKAPDISWVRVRPEDFPLTNPLIKNSGWFVMGILHSSRIVSPIFHARALKGNTTTVFYTLIITQRVLKARYLWIKLGYLGLGLPENSSVWFNQLGTPKHPKSAPFFNGNHPTRLGVTCPDRSRQNDQMARPSVVAEQPKQWWSCQKPWSFTRNLRELGYKNPGWHHIKEIQRAYIAYRKMISF